MSAEDPVTVALDAQLSPQAAQALFETLKGVDTSAPLEIDAAQVETVSTLAVLTLMSAIQARPDGAPQVRVAGPTPAFLDAFQDLGMFSDLMKMEFV